MRRRLAAWMTETPRLGVPRPGRAGRGGWGESIVGWWWRGARAGMGGEGGMSWDGMGGDGRACLHLISEAGAGAGAGAGAESGRQGLTITPPPLTRTSFTLVHTVNNQLHIMARANAPTRPTLTSRGTNPFLAGAFASPNKKSTLNINPSPSKARNPSPKKQQRMADEAQRVAEAEADNAVLQLEAMVANFEIEGRSPSARREAAECGRSIPASCGY